MLYKNDKEFKLSPEQKKEFGVRMKFILPENTKQWDPKNKRWNCPKSTNIEPFYTFYDPKEQDFVTLRYALSASKGAKDEINYQPELITIGHSGDYETKKEQTDLNFFMCNHPSCGSNENRDTAKAVKFLRENKQEIAKGKAEKSKLLAEAMSYIYEVAAETKLREIAKSLEIPFVDDMELEEVQVELEAIAKRDPRFFSNRKESPNVSIRAKIQEAIDGKIIDYNEDEKFWFYTTNDTDKPGEKIFDVKAGQDKTEALVSFLHKSDKKNNIANIAALVKKAAEAAV